MPLRFDVRSIVNRWWTRSTSFNLKLSILINQVFTIWYNRRLLWLFSVLSCLNCFSAVTPTDTQSICNSQFLFYGRKTFSSSQLLSVFFFLTIYYWMYSVKTNSGTDKEMIIFSATFKVKLLRLKYQLFLITKQPIM